MYFYGVELRLTNRRSPVTISPRAHIIMLRRRGMTLMQIAERAGVNYRTVQAIAASPAHRHTDATAEKILAVNSAGIKNKPLNAGRMRPEK